MKSLSLLRPVIRSLASPTVFSAAVLLFGCTGKPSNCPPTVSDRAPTWTSEAERTGVPLPPAAPGQKHGGWIFRANRQPARGVIICLHGISTHAAWFQPLAAHLNQVGYDLVCPNRPGSGENPRSSKADTQNGEDLIAALEPAFAEARRQKSDVFLLGTSWAAKLAVATAAQHREELKGLILLVPAFKAKKENLFVGLTVALGNLLAPEGTLPSPDPEEYLPSSAKATSAATLSEINRDGMMLCRATHRFHWQSRALQKKGISRLQQQGLPTLAMFAADDQVVDRDASQKIAFEIAATVALFPGEGHAIQVQTPDRVAQTIVEWIETGQLEKRENRQILQRTLTR